MGKDFMKGALIGAIVGAIAGVLMAPKSGKETREGMKKYYEEMRNKVSGKIAAIKGMTASKYDNVIDEIISEYQKAEKITKEEAKEIKEKLKDVFEKY